MHGCGHDGHTTMLLAAARYLHETRNFDGTAYLIFQPGEEGYAGAKAMIEDGLFERFPAEQVFALHNWPGLPPGRIGITPGPAMAAADRIEITIDGRGGHGAHPHAAIDPVLVAGHIITAAQSIVSRNVSPIDTAVVSLCAMQAGNPGAMSVIPAHAKLVGTVRTFRPATQDMIERRLNELVPSIAAAFGAKATLKYERVYPATINHEREADVRGGRRRVARRPRQRRAQPRPVDGLRGFLVHAAGEAGRVRAAGAGRRRRRLLPAQQHLRFQRRVIPLGAGYLAALAEQAMPLAPALSRRGCRNGCRRLFAAATRRRAKVPRGRRGARARRSSRTCCPICAAPRARHSRWTSRWPAMRRRRAC